MVLSCVIGFLLAPGRGRRWGQTDRQTDRQTDIHSSLKTQLAERPVDWKPDLVAWLIADPPRIKLQHFPKITYIAIIVEPVIKKKKNRSETAKTDGPVPTPLCLDIFPTPQCLQNMLFIAFDCARLLARLGHVCSCLLMRSVNPIKGGTRSMKRLTSGPW